jgi:hypothetical protein
MTIFILLAAAAGTIVPCVAIWLGDARRATRT